MTHIEGEKRHQNLRRATKVVALGIGAALFISGASVTVEGASPANEQVIPVPCTEPMPWDPSTTSNSKSGSIEIQLASINLPEPQKAPAKSECWIVTPGKTN